MTDVAGLAIRTQDLRKTYKSSRGDVQAVRGIDLGVHSGQFFGLLGPNGAGKSTLTKIMAGVVEATSGEMLFDSRPVSFANPAEAMANGVNMVFQENTLVPSMTVAQNLYLGDEKFFAQLNRSSASKKETDHVGAVTQKDKEKKSGWGKLAKSWDAARFEAAMEAQPASEERTRLVGDLGQISEPTWSR